MAKEVEMTLIFAKQMGERFLPTFNKRTRFSTITQTAFDVSLAADYPKEAFTPPPSSDCIGLKFHNRQKSPFVDEKDLNEFLAFLKIIYVLPNKQLGIACCPIGKVSIVNEALLAVGLQRTDRVFSVPIHKLIELCRSLNSVLLESNHENTKNPAECA